MKKNITFIHFRSKSIRKDRDLAKSEANSHIAKHGHRRRAPSVPTKGSTDRLNKALVGEASKESETNDNSISPHASAAGLPPTDRPAVQLTKSQHQSTSKSITNSKDDRHTEQASSASGYINPWIAISNGNSDPFSCMPIQITAEVNDIIVFFHSRFLNLFTNGSLKLDTPKKVYQTVSQGLIYDTNIESLQDECSSRSFLVFINAVRAKTPEYGLTPMEAKMLEIDSQRILRLRLGASNKVTNPILYSVVAQFGASVMMQDFQQAVYHAKYLRYLLLTRVKKGATIPLGLLKQALWADTQLSVIRLERSVLEGEDWIPAILDPIEQSLETCLTDLPLDLTSPTSLDPNVSNEPLRSCIVRLRQCFALAKDPSDKFLDLGISSVLFIACNMCLCELWLVKHYLDTRDQLNNQKTQLSQPDRLRYHLESMVSITMIYMLDRLSLHHCCYAQYIPKSDMLMSVMQSEISQTLRYVVGLGAEAHGHEPACVFALFIEAQGQRWKARKDKIRYDSRRDQHFVAIAKNLKLKSWDEVRSVLEMFLYSEILEPDGKDWVGGLLRR